MSRLTVVGDVLLDVDWSGPVRRLAPDAPVPVVEADGDRRRPGGAGLAATLAAARGATVTLVTALGRDAEARELRDRLDAAGVQVVDLGLDGPTPQKLRVQAGGQSLVRVDRACEPVVPPGPWTEAADEALAGAGGVLVADYGRGVAERAMPALRALTGPGAGGGGPHPPVVWDPHRAGPVPPPGLAAVTPNASEAARALDEPEPATVPELAEAAERLVAAWGSPIVLTCGERGALVADPPGPTALVPATPVLGDTCGAGDCLAATLTAGLARGRDLIAAAGGAVAAAGRFVRDGDATEGGGPAVTRIAPGTADGERSPASEPPGPDARRLAEEVRAAGGTVVAAGGCFDLLHPGHLRTLEAARAAGDCLIVCLNGDGSVRRLKGPGRPVNPAEDRARLLLGLSCVDAVTVFDEDTPVAALETIRPQVFVKGGDYAGVEIAEADALAAWGGRVLVLPLVEGRSTSRMIERAASHRTPRPAPRPEGRPA